MSKITFDDKVDIRQTDLPRKNYIGAADINEVKAAVNNIALFTHEVTLTKAQLNTINDDGGIEIPLSDFGCKSGEDIQIHLSYSIVKVFRDGVDFNSTGQLLNINKGSFRVAALIDDVIESTEDGSYSGALQAFRYHLHSSTPYTLDCSTNITGGGANAYIKIKFYYQIITV